MRRCASFSSFAGVALLFLMNPWRRTMDSPTRGRRLWQSARRPDRSALRIDRDSLRSAGTTACRTASRIRPSSDPVRSISDPPARAPPASPGPVPGHQPADRTGLRSIFQVSPWTAMHHNWYNKCNPVVQTGKDDVAGPGDRTPCRRLRPEYPGACVILRAIGRAVRALGRAAADPPNPDCPRACHGQRRAS